MERKGFSKSGRIGWIGRVGQAMAALGVVGGLLFAAACGQAQEGEAGGAPAQSGAGGSASGAPTFRIGAIPDQDISVLSRQFGAVSGYLSEVTGLRVEYVPSSDYAALVAAFERGDIHLAWFGGLTAVQAMAVEPTAEAFAQRPRDAEFHSRFIVQADLPVQKLEDLRGLRFTFGSESSTSGHVMPRYFLMKAGIDPEKDFNGPPSYSGSHDKTIELVQSGAFQAGALNEAVWERRVKEGTVDAAKVRDFYTTPAYFDYNWTIRGDVDQTFGEGTKEKITQAILSMGPEQKEILDLFQTDSFVPTKNENYQAIREVAEAIGIIR